MSRVECARHGIQNQTISLILGELMVRFWLHLEDDGASSRLVDWGTIKAVIDMCLFEAKSSMGAEVNLEE